jgi:chemotaxis protein MotB
MADDKPIIVIKKKGGHGGHHGGAWKVAFADFMTAMMCFFLVMWLVGTADVNTKQNIARYFRQPGLFVKGSGTPLLIGEGGILRDGYVPPHPARENKYRGKGEDPQQAKGGTDLDVADKEITVKGGKKSATFYNSNVKPEENPDEIVVDDTAGAKTKLQKAGGNGNEDGAAAERARFEELAQEITQKVQHIPELSEQLGNLEVKLESDGLVLEIMDTDHSSMFHSSSTQILPDAQKAFTQIASLLAEFPNKIDIIGHTDAKPFSSRRNGYSNWDLSSDRANAARRILEASGIERERILSVIGRADKDLKAPEDPYGAQNRRISLKMRFSKDNVISAGKLPSALDGLRDFTHKETSPPPALPQTDSQEAIEETTVVPKMKKPASKFDEPVHEMQDFVTIDEPLFPIHKPVRIKPKSVKLPEDPSDETESNGTPDVIFKNNPVINSGSIFSD